MTRATTSSGQSAVSRAQNPVNHSGWDPRIIWDAELELARRDWPDYNRISCFHNDFRLRHVDIRSFAQLREFAAACDEPVDDSATVVPMRP